MMKAWWHWVIAILGVVVAVVLLGVGALTYLVLRLDVRGEIVRVVESATGRHLTIAGDVGVSYWPVLGLRANNVSLANVPGGRAPDFVHADEIDIGVELGPLLSQQVVVRNLVLQHPRIALEVDAAGKPNWIFAPAPAPASSAPAHPPPQHTSPAPATSAGMTLRSIQINSGEATYYDARHGSGWSVGDVNLTSALTAANQPVHASGSIKFNDKPVQLDISVANPGAITIAQPTPLSITAHGDLLDATFTGQTLAVGDLTGQIHASGPNLRQLAAWFGAPLQGGYGLEHFDVAGTLSTGSEGLAFSDTGFAVDLIKGRGDFAVSQQRGKPYISGRLQLFDLDLNPYLLGHAPPQPAAQSAPAPGPLPAELDALKQQPAAPNAQIAAVAPPPRPIDVQAPPSSTPIDFSGLRAFNADLDLVTGAILVHHSRVDAARMSVVLNDGYIAATVQNVSLYGGTGHGRFEIDARQPEAKYVEDFVFDGLNAQSFLTDAVNFTNIEGRAEISLTWRSHGRTISDLLTHTDGRTHIELVSGVLHGVDMGGVSRTIRNALRGELIAPEAKTPFQGFSATFAVADGVLASDDLSFNTPDLRIPGVAVIDIPQKRLDLRVAPRSPHGGIAIPFAARGPWSQLEYTSDLTGRALHAITPRVTQVQAASRATN
jgi:AsmA protein